MATFCYTTDDGETVEECFPCGKAPPFVTLTDGRRADRDYAAEIRGVHSQPSSGWPRYSQAMAVNPKQVKAAAEQDREMGVPTDYCEKTGRVKFDNPSHEYKWMKAHGAHNYDGGYRSN